MDTRDRDNSESPPDDDQIKDALTEGLSEGLRRYLARTHSAIGWRDGKPVWLSVEEIQERADDVDSRLEEE